VAVRKTPTLDAETENPELPEYYPKDENAIIPFSYTDYVVALQAKRVCKLRDDGDLEITGLHDKGYSWQVPFVKCDSRKCAHVGQDAQPFCEYSFLVVSGSHLEDAGGHERASQFREWIYNKWPILRPQQSGNGTSGLPFEFDFVQHFPDPTTMDDYVKRLDYGTDQVPKMAMGIVFDGNSPDAFKYTPPRLDHDPTHNATIQQFCQDRLGNVHPRSRLGAFGVLPKLVHGTLRVQWSDCDAAPRGGLYPGPNGRRRGGILCRGRGRSVCAVSAARLYTFGLLLHGPK
jgi:hypothetical protein